jgi:hypothetical protein
MSLITLTKVSKAPPQSMNNMVGEQRLLVPYNGADYAVNPHRDFPTVHCSSKANGASMKLLIDVPERDVYTQLCQLIQGGR